MITKLIYDRSGLRPTAHEFVYSEPLGGILKPYFHIILGH